MINNLPVETIEKIMNKLALITAAAIESVMVLADKYQLNRDELIRMWSEATFATAHNSSYKFYELRSETNGKNQQL